MDLFAVSASSFGGALFFSCGSLLSFGSPDFLGWGESMTIEAPASRTMPFSGTFTRLYQKVFSASGSINIIIDGSTVLAISIINGINNMDNC
jgi:hypothetical protein